MFYEESLTWLLSRHVPKVIISERSTAAASATPEPKLSTPGNHIKRTEWADDARTNRSAQRGRHLPAPTTQPIISIGIGSTVSSAVVVVGLASAYPRPWLRCCTGESLRKVPSGSEPELRTFPAHTP